jgi:hypothetical protein
MRSIMPLFAIGITIIMLIVYIVMTKNETKKPKPSKNNTNAISQYFINVMDIHDNILYGLDGYKRVFIEIEGVCIDLLNKNDINRLIRELSSEISKLNIEFDLFAISRPFNIDTLKEQYEDDILNAKTDIQRTLLRNSLNQIENFGENGDVVERKFYISVQGMENEVEIEKNAELLMECFKNSNITSYRLKDAEIKRLINLFNNMTSYNYDNLEETYNSIPVINKNLEKEKTIDEKLKEKLEKEKIEQEMKNAELKKQEEEKLKNDKELIDEIKNKNQSAKEEYHNENIDIGKEGGVADEAEKGDEENGKEEVEG